VDIWTSCDFGGELTERMTWETKAMFDLSFACACDNLSNLLILVDSWIKSCHRHWYSFYLQIRKWVVVIWNEFNELGEIDEEEYECLMARLVMLWIWYS